MNPYIRKKFIVADLQYIEQGHQDLINVAANNRSLENPLLPDEYWVGINPDHEFYTAGAEAFNSIEEVRNAPKEIDGIPVIVRRGNGKWSWNGPGQLGLCMCLHRRSFQHRGFMDNITRIATAIGDYIYDNHGVKCRIVIDGDAGIFEETTGAKLVSHTFNYIDKHLVMAMTMNFSCDLDKFKPIEVCGVKDRLMGNILPAGQQLTAELAEKIGDDLLDIIWRGVYDQATQFNLYVGDSEEVINIPV